MEQKDNRNKIAIASDHAGYKLKETLKQYLLDNKYEVQDFGPETDAVRVDYPDYAVHVCNAVKEQNVRGVLCCGTGCGISIAANKFVGIRAGLVIDEATAKQCREHVDCNIVSFGQKTIEPELAKKSLKVFLETEALDDPVYKGRVQKIIKIENKNLQ